MKEIMDYLNANPAQVAVLAAIAAVALQYLVNRIKKLGEVTNYALGLVALPGFTVGVAAYVTSLHLGTAYPWVVVAGQALYAVLEEYKRRVIAKATKTIPEPSFLDDTTQPSPVPTVSEY